MASSGTKRVPAGSDGGRRMNFTWDPTVQQYRGPNGRFVSRAEIRAALDKALDQERIWTRVLAQDFRLGRITLMQWRQEMRDVIKNVHLFSAALARGGWAQLTQADYGRVGNVVRGEYGYLERFAVGLSNGSIPTDGTFVDRATMYAEAGRDTYHQVQRVAMSEAGWKFESNKLNPAEHCTGSGSCVEQTERGRVPIGKLIPIGRRRCLRKCRCDLEFWETRA